MAPIPIRSISNYGYADWLHVIHPDTEGTSHAPAEHIEHARSIEVTPTNACRDKFLHGRAIICVHNTGSGSGTGTGTGTDTFGKRTVTQAGGLGKRLIFTRTWEEWWAHPWYEFKEFFHHSGSKGHINLKRGAGDVVNGNATAPVLEGENHSKERHFGECIKTTYLKFINWTQSSGQGDVAVNWRRGNGVEEMTQNVETSHAITRHSSKNSEFAHIALRDIAWENTNHTHPVNLLNSTGMGISGNVTRHAIFSGFHFVEAQAVDGSIPLGIPNYAFALRDSEFEKIVGCFFAGVFVFFGIKWGLNALMARRRC